MANTAINANNVTIANTIPDAGIVYWAPKGTALPTKFTKPSELVAAFTSLGDLSEDGFSETTDSSSDDKKDMAGNVVLSVSKGKTRSFKFTFIEAMRAELMKFIYGEKNVELNTPGNTLKHIKMSGEDTPECVLVVYEVMSNGTLRMTVIDRAKADSYDEISHNRNDLLSYGVTIKALDNGGKVGDVWFAEVA